MAIFHQPPRPRTLPEIAGSLMIRAYENPLVSINKASLNPYFLGGGFKTFYFHPDRPEKMIQFDYIIFSKWVETQLNHQPRGKALID